MVDAGADLLGKTVVGGVIQGRVRIDALCKIQQGRIAGN
jgi:mannose/fructose/N-acetylgalactosamine-specific phosphotransferase system component IID